MLRNMITSKSRREVLLYAMTILLCTVVGFLNKEARCKADQRHSITSIVYHWYSTGKVSCEVSLYPYHPVSYSIYSMCAGDDANNARDLYLYFAH